MKKRMKKLFALIAVTGCLTVADFSGTPLWQGSTCHAATEVQNNGSYSLTSQTVSIETESGHSKGSFSVYLHHGKRYIRFQNNWICIQGKSRFFLNGNWYVIK